MNTLSDDVNQGFEGALAAYGSAPLKRSALDHLALDGLSARALVDAAIDVRTAPLLRDQLWTAVIWSYRQGPRGFWGPVVLQAAVPTLLRKAAKLRYDPELGEDVNHQLIAAVLEAAVGESLPRPARWTPNRLATRAVTRTRRWIVSEARSRCVPLHELPERSSTPAPDPDEFASLMDRLRGWGIGDEMSVLLYRHRVLGEPLTRIAKQLGTTEKALQMRRFRAEERIRRQLAA